MENETDLVRASSLSQSKKRAPSVTNLSQSRRTEQQNESEASKKTASSMLVSGLNLSREISRSIQRQKPLLEIEYNVDEIKIPMNQDCSICLETQPLYFLLNCNHSFCRECLDSYLEGAITSAELPVYCPQVGCGKEIDETDVEKLVSEEIHTKFQRFMLKLNTPEVRDCPKCEHLCHPEKKSQDDDSLTDNSVTCPKCGTVFCMVHSNAHPPTVTCEAYEKVLKKMGGEKTEKLLKNMKRCPSCGVPTERTSGCPMMSCVNCHANWCYVCGGNVAGSNEFSYRCTRCGANAFREHSDPTCCSCCLGAVCCPCWFTCGLLYSLCCCSCCLCLEGCSCSCYMSTFFWFEASREWFWCPWMLCCKDGKDIWENKNEKEWNKRVYDDNEVNTI